MAPFAPGRARDRADARPDPARPAHGARLHVRRPGGAGSGHGVGSTLGALPGRAGHDGAVEVVRRAQGRRHAAGAALGDHARHHQLPAHRRSAWPRRRCSARSRRGWPALGLRGRAGLRGAAGGRGHDPVPADPGVGGGHRGRGARCPAHRRRARQAGRTPMGARVAVALWGNGAIRVLTGFLTLFVAFVVKARPRRTHPATGADRHRRRRGRARVVRGNASARGQRSATPTRRRAWCSARRWRSRSWPRCCPASHGGRRRPRRRRGERARQGQPRCSDPARHARGVARVGVRAVGDRAAARVGVRRGAGSAAAARHVWIGFTVVACGVALVGLQTTLLYSGRSIAPFLAVPPQPVAPTVPSARGP